MPDLTMQDVIVEGETAGLTSADVIVENEPTGSPVSSMALPAAGAMAMAPGIVSAINSTAKVAGPMASKAMKGRAGLTGLVTAGAAAGGQLAKGDIKGAAVTGAGVAGGALAPKAIGMVQKLTAPSVGLIRNPVGRFVTGSGRPAVLARGAGALSKAAGPVGVLSTLYDLLQGARGLAARDRQLPPDARAALEQQLAANNHQF
jgi:hypothetical protein